MNFTLSKLINSSFLTAFLAISSSILLPQNPASAFSVSFGETSQSSNNPATGTSASIDFDFTQIDSGIRLDLDITNTTAQTDFGSEATKSILTAVLFDLPGVTLNLDLVTGNAFFPELLVGEKLPPFGTFDVAISNDDQILGGNPNNGLRENQSTIVSLLLTGTSQSAETIENEFFTGFKNNELKIATRFQAVNAGGGSDKLLGGSVIEEGGITPDPTQKVPEPGLTAALSLFVPISLLYLKKKKVYKIG
ncbi:MAG: hypothetical protein QNJ54_34045 [Prochloraceae cyanobacterium]|nr:hypothetical protein [Prochloraceae cyanobacterium]